VRPTAAATASLAPATTVQDLLETAGPLLGAAGIEAPRAEAALLLSDVLDCDRAALLARPERSVPPPEVERYAALVDRRSRLEPVAYIIGECEFFGRRFFVDKRALIPRPETELLVETALEEIGSGPPKQLIVDVGTGTGCIAATLALGATSACVVAVDLSADALELAQLNLHRLRVSDRVWLVRGELLAWLRPRSGSVGRGLVPYREGFEPQDLGRWTSPHTTNMDEDVVVVANLPYIPTEAYDQLPPDVRHYEPRLALDGGPRGTHLLLRLLRQTSQLGVGALLAELDPRHADEVLSAAHGYFPDRPVEILFDLAGRQRLLRVGRTR
jgi:release factor glutamine methyltransferase